MSQKTEQGTIEKVVNGGKRLLRSPNGVVFLDGGLPGEEVLFEVQQKQKGTQYGKTLEVLKASPHRQASDCEIFPACGGCNLIDADPSHRRQIKTDMLMDVLKRMGKWDDGQLAKVKPLRTPHENGGRIRATLHVSPSGDFGFFAPQSHDLISLEQCPALHPTLQTFVSELKQQTWGPFEEGWQLQMACAPDGQVAVAMHDLPLDLQKQLGQTLLDTTVCTGVHLLHAQGHTIDTLGQSRLQGVIAGSHPAGPFEHDPATFTQSSFWGGQALLEEMNFILDGMDGPLETCIELFSGAGHFSFALLDRFEDLLCIEGDPRAYFWLAENRGKHPQQDNMEIWQAMVDGGRVDLLPDIMGIDLLVMDPPRQGIKQVGNIIDALKPRHVIMVSCEMASGIRDLNQVEQQGYELQSLQPLDIFERNHHLEWIAWLAQA